MSTGKKPTTMASLDVLIKEAYQSQLNDQLNKSLIFFALPEPYKPTRKERWGWAWERFWGHIPDFYKFIRSYEYHVWMYKE